MTILVVVILHIFVIPHKSDPFLPLYTAGLLPHDRDICPTISIQH